MPEESGVSRNRLHPRAEERAPATHEDDLPHDRRLIIMALTLPSRTDYATVPTSYRAALVQAFHEPLTLEDVPTPALAAGQILVRVEASGLCHTGIHAAHGDSPVKPSPPFIPGHEGVGIVATRSPCRYSRPSSTA
jgi:hypothetical protein